MTQQTLIESVQIQEVESALVELFELTLKNELTIYLFNGLDEGENNIYFPSATIVNGVYPLNEYIAIPIQLEGIEITSSGALARPTLSTVNFPTLAKVYEDDNDGIDDETTLFDILESQGIRSNQDLLGSRLIYRRTLLKYTFTSQDTATSSPPVEFPSTKLIIDRVAAEDNMLVQFELANPMDIEGVVLPSRVIVGRYCPWRYQGRFLYGDGGCSWPVDSSGVFFDTDNNRITNTGTEWTSASAYSVNDVVKTTDITTNYIQIWKAKRDVPADKNPIINPFYWYRLDMCGKTLTSCKVRFQNTGVDGEFDTEVPLPFGGFPGSKTFK
jgi:phage-related protein